MDRLRSGSTKGTQQWNGLCKYRIGMLTRLRCNSLFSPDSPQSHILLIFFRLSSLASTKNGSLCKTASDSYDFFDEDDFGRPITTSAKIPMFPEDFKSGQYRDRTTGQVQTEWPLSWWGIVQPSKELLDEHRRGYPKLRRMLADREEAAKRVKVEAQPPLAAGGGGGGNGDAPHPAVAPTAAGRYDYGPPHHQRGPPGSAGQDHYNPLQRQAQGYPDQRQHQQHHQQQRRPDQPPYPPQHGGPQQGQGGRYPPPGSGPPGPHMGGRGPPMNMMGRGGGGGGPGRGGMGGPPHGLGGGRGGPPMMHGGGRGPGGRDGGRGRGGGGYGGGYR